MVIYEPAINLSILKEAEIHLLDDELAKQVWRIRQYEQCTPSGFVTRVKAHVVGWNDPILPVGGIGIDPGLNLGIAVLFAEDVAHTLSLRLDRSTLSSAELLSCLHSIVKVLPNQASNKRTPVVVEGAAYNAKYGQPLLGEIRAALILSFVNAGYEIIAEVPPLSIRRKVFGNASLKPKEDIWPDLPSDSAAALSMAICAGL